MRMLILKHGRCLAFNAALDRAQADGNVVLLAGGPGMFSAGFDLAVFKQDPALQLRMLKGGAETAQRLLSFPAPVVAACTGHAIAMGAFLILSCDVRIGVLDGPFKICVNEVQIGMTVPPPAFLTHSCRQRSCSRLLTPRPWRCRSSSGTPMWRPRSASARAH